MQGIRMVLCALILTTSKVGDLEDHRTFGDTTAYTTSLELRTAGLDSIRSWRKDSLFDHSPIDCLLHGIVRTPNGPDFARRRIHGFNRGRRGPVSDPARSQWSSQERRFLALEGVAFGRHDRDPASYSQAKLASLDTAEPSISRVVFLNPSTRCTA